tara:strand:+ start:874 stop:1014 length:141 start_codon:yes stop_codon:yes gene_type:complete
MKKDSSFDRGKKERGRKKFLQEQKRIKRKKKERAASESKWKDENYE